MLPPPPPQDAPINVDIVRAGMNKMSAGKEKALNTQWQHLVEKITVENVMVSMRDGHKAEIRIIKSTNTKAGETLPVYLSCHGGAFIAGNNETEELINRQLAFECNVVVFSLDYRLAPEHDVTTTIYNDAEDGLKWTYEHASEYGGDTKKGLIVGGTSVGALLANVLAFRSQKLGIRVDGEMLRQSAVMFTLDGGKEEWKSRITSYEENADAPLLNFSMIEKISKLLHINPAHARDPWYFPVFASKEELTRLPPTYVVAAGVDPVVDDVLLLKDLLVEAGVPTKFNLYEVSCILDVCI